MISTTQKPVSWGDPITPRLRIRLRLKEVLVERGIAQLTLSQMSRVSPATIHRYVRNSRTGALDGPPLEEVSLRALAQIAQVLEIDPKDLFVTEDSQVDDVAE